MVSLGWESMPLEPPVGHRLQWRRFLQVGLFVILPNFSVSTSPGDLATRSPSLVSCLRRALDMLCSHRSFRDMYVCKGDCLLAQIKLGREPQTHFCSLILIFFGAVDRR